MAAWHYLGFRDPRRPATPCAVEGIQMVIYLVAPVDENHPAHKLTQGGLPKNTHPYNGWAPALVLALQQSYWLL